MAAVARLLAPDNDVTVFTSARDRRAARGVDLGAEIVFVDEPRSWDTRMHFNLAHAWSAALHRSIVAHYPRSGPQLIEFADTLGEGCVTVQAKRTAAPKLAGNEPRLIAERSVWQTDRRGRLQQSETGLFHIEESRRWVTG